MTTPFRLGEYLHHSGRSFRVFTTARDHSNYEEMIVYRETRRRRADVWVRSRRVFEEVVMSENGKTMPRFKYVDKP